jgi:hypothetical protein
LGLLYKSGVRGSLIDFGERLFEQTGLSVLLFFPYEDERTGHRSHFAAVSSARILPGLGLNLPEIQVHGRREGLAILARTGKFISSRWVARIWHFFPPFLIDPFLQGLGRETSGQSFPYVLNEFAATEQGLAHNGLFPHRKFPSFYRQKKFST